MVKTKLYSLSLTLCIFLFLQGFGTFICAQKAWLAASVDSVQNGERFTLTLSVAVGAGQVLIPPSVGKPWGDADLLRELAREKSRTNNGPEVTAIQFESAVFGLDSVQVRLPYGLVTGKDTLWQTTPPLSLKIKSVVPQNAQELKDLTPIAEFGADWKTWLWVGLLLVGVTILGWWLWRKYRKQPEDKPLPEPVPVLTLYERALARLDALETWELQDPEQVKAYYTELSEVLRMYLEKTLRIPALESTTGELLALLRAKEGRKMRLLLPSSTVNDLGSILSLSDLVKFADFIPQNTAHAETLQQAKNLLQNVEFLLRPAATDQQKPVDQSEQKHDFT